MAIHRGIQSVIFFYVSCAPCVATRDRKKRKQDAVRGRADREALAAEMPGMYRHPSPSSTNPYWQSEIAAGPVLVSRGKKKTATNAAVGSHRNLKTSMTQRSNESNPPSSVDLSLNGGSRDGRTDSKIHFQQFQREDEEAPLGLSSMEGLASSSTLDGSLSGSRITRPQRAHIIMTDAEKSHANHRNPQINDLHPATVTNISSREEARWLMQPPPSADFMSGKDCTGRSRSDSGGSSRMSARSGVPLSREVAQRMMERRLKGEDPPLTPTMSRENTSLASTDPKGQNHDRSMTNELDFALEDSPSNRLRRRSSPVRIQVSDNSNSSQSAVTVIRSSDFAPETVRARRVASKPQLSTIASDSLLPADTYNTQRKENKSSRHSDDSLPDRDRTARRSPLLAKDDSLKVLQDLAPHSRLFNTQVISSQDVAKRSRHPSHDTDGGAEMYDSWYTPDFALPEWVHEHTKREGIRERWSMDI